MNPRRYPMRIEPEVGISGLLPGRPDFVGGIIVLAGGTPTAA